MGRNKKLSQADKGILCEKFRNGITVTELAIEYDVTRNTIKNYLKAEGLWKGDNSLKVSLDDERVQSLLKSNKSATEIARELGCSIDTVRRKKLQMENKEYIPKSKRINYVKPEINGGIRAKKNYRAVPVNINGKNYVDVTDIINNLNDIF